MRWLWPRRPKRDWAMLTHRNVHTAVTAAPLPSPRELVAVIGIGRTEIVNGVALTLLSLERYREADVATFRLVHRRGLHLDFPSPDLGIRVDSPDGLSRRVWMMGGGGGGGGQELIFRYSFASAPPIPDEREAEIVVAKIDWVSHAGVERRVASSDVGPWRFTVRT